MDWVYALDIFGTLVFAISGILTAIDNDFDLVGSAIIGLVTAVGGGTLRDILLGATPVGWLHDSNYIFTVILALILSYTLKNSILKLRKSMFLFDTIGIGLFTILGVKKGLLYDLPTSSIIMMGVVSAVFGGVIRDVLTNVVPLIFRKEIYATACIIGASVFLLLNHYTHHDTWSMIVSMLVVMIIRYLAVIRNWSLYISK